MSVGNVKNYLAQQGYDKDILVSELSCATVKLAAEALGVTASRIAKTISFAVANYPKDAHPSLASAHGCILIVTSGDSKINSPKFKKYFGHKARMLSADETLAATGYTIGGVCPFAIQSDKVSIYLDVSLQRFSTVFPACGSSNSLIELGCNELFTYSRAKGWVDICKGWQDNIAN